MRSSTVVALFTLLATPMLAVAYPTNGGGDELNLRALAEEHSITARQIAAAMVDIFERSFDEGDLVRRAPPKAPKTSTKTSTKTPAKGPAKPGAPPNGDCSSGQGQSNMTGPACAQSHGYGWLSNGLCFSRQQMMMQGNVMRGVCYY